MASASLQIRLLISTTQKPNRQLSLRSWNVLTLASLSRESTKSAHALMAHFPSFAATFRDSLILPWSFVPTDRASTVNHCYTGVKLWLLLAEKMSKDSAGDVSNSTSFMVWNELWPSFLRLYTELTTSSQKGVDVVSSLNLRLCIFLLTVSRPW